MTTTITANQILTARSISDANCRFELSVIERKGTFATVAIDGIVRRVKIRKDDDGEFLRPDSYSMAPIYR